MISKNRVLYTFLKILTALKIVCGFAKLEVYLINGIIRTKVLDRLANTIVNQNSFQVSGEFLDQRQNLILLNRGNHLG